MAKIQTKKDLAKKKIYDKDKDDPGLDEANATYIEDLLKKKRSELVIPKNDINEDIKHLTSVFDKTLLTFERDKNGIILAVQDNRIAPAEAKKLLEFAGRVTGGDRNLIVEMADRGYKVYDKEATYDDKDRLETAEYPRKKRHLELADRK